MLVAKRARRAAGSSPADASHAGGLGGGQPRCLSLPSAGAADAGTVARPGDGDDRGSGELPASADRDDDGGPCAAGAHAIGRRADLRQDTIEILRAQHRRLKVAAREAQREMRNAKKRRNRVLTRLRNLDTASVLAVLMDRVANPGGAPSPLEAAIASASRAGASPHQLAEGGLLGAPLPAPASLPDSEPRSPTDTEGDAASDQPHGGVEPGLDVVEAAEQEAASAISAAPPSAVDGGHAADC